MTEITLPGRPASQGTVVEQSRAVAEVAAAVRVARDFPRDIDRATAETQQTCDRLSVAEQAFYEVPNRGSGPSVHLARELARIWGNLDYGVRELNRDDKSGVSEMQAWAWDQQTNVRSTRSFIQPHQRMRGGRRQDLTDLGDIYLNNQNTAARAVRECIFTVLPTWFVDDAMRQLRTTLENGGGKSIAERRAEAIAAFGQLRVTQAQLEDRLGKQAAQWAPADFADLNRAYSSITKDGIPVSEFFPEKAVEVAQ